MRWGDDTEEAFPPQHPRERGGLRQDILDEIADHLACAAQREAERGGKDDSEESAWGRVLERFGNPDAIARRLWWDEMRETVMREWIQTGVVVVVAIAVVVFMALVLRQMTTANQAVLEALKSNATAVNPLVTLKVKVTRGTEDGPPAEGVEIMLMGAAFGSESVQIRRSTDSMGSVTFGPMQAGQFEALASDRKSGLRLDGSVAATLFAGSDSETIQIVAPDVDPRLTNLEFSSPLMLGGGRALHVQLMTEWKGGGTTWQGQSVAIVNDAGVRSLDPDITDTSYSTVPGDESLWSTLTPENAPLMVSGDIENAQLVLIGRTASGEQETQRASLKSSEIVPAQDATGYRLELPEAFKKQVDDWRVEDQAKVLGVELDDALFTEIRTQFPAHLVESASLIDETFWAFQSGANLFGMAPGSSQEGRDRMEISSIVQQNYARFSGEGSNVALFSAPAVEYLEGPANSRVVLAIASLKFTPMEPENELQVWSIFNDALKSMSTADGPNSAGFAPELGAEPSAVRSNVELAELGERSNWFLFDLTTSLSEIGAGGRPKAFMMRWSHDESKYSSFLELIGSKNTDYRQLRPMWLVLKPMDGAEEVAAAQ